jgi:hypothetical protein
VTVTIETRNVEMNSISFDATIQLEQKLSGIYENVYKEKSHLLDQINQYPIMKKCNNAQKALLLHGVINVSAIIGLFYLLY